jgi:hypothetical protein
MVAPMQPRRTVFSSVDAIRQRPHAAGSPSASHRKTVSNGTTNAHTVAVSGSSVARDQRPFATVARRRPCGAGTDARKTAMATYSRGHAQQDEAKHDEHARHHVGRRSVVRRLELIEDRRRERVEPQHRVQAVLGQQMKTNEQPTGCRRRGEVRNDHSHENGARR